MTNKEGKTMTRKQYVAKMRQFALNMNNYAKEHGMKYPRNWQRVNSPNWGTLITAGRHAGEN